MLGDSGTTSEETERARRIWVRDGRLRGIPAKRSRRRPVLDLVAQDFEPGRTYSAGEVRDILARWLDDTATLGRHLVDEGFMNRLDDGSRWWRCGGSVDV